MNDEAKIRAPDGHVQFQVEVPGAARHGTTLISSETKVGHDAFPRASLRSVPPASKPSPRYVAQTRMDRE